MKYILTLDSHDYYGPFWSTADHSSYWWAQWFADHRRFRSYTVISKLPEFATPIAPSCLAN